MCHISIHSVSTSFSVKTLYVSLLRSVPFSFSGGRRHLRPLRLRGALSLGPGGLWQRLLGPRSTAFGTDRGGEEGHDDG